MLRCQKIAEGLHPLQICVNFSSLFFLARGKSDGKVLPVLQGKYTICRVENGIPSNICVTYFPPWENAPSERRVSSFEEEEKEEEEEGKDEEGKDEDGIWSSY